MGSIAANNVNNNPNRLRVDLEEYDNYDGTQELTTPGGASQASDPWKNTNMGFRNTTAPNSNSYNGSETNVWVWNISAILPDDNMTIGFNEINTYPTGIYITDPVSDITISPEYDFLLNDTEFPDEDVGIAPGSYVVQHSPTGLNIWSLTPFQTPIEWTGGVGGTINCSGIPNGTWDFRVKITDEEGHMLRTSS
jgi:hypothetical protein